MKYNLRLIKNNVDLDISKYQVERIKKDNHKVIKKFLYIINKK